MHSSASRTPMMQSLLAIAWIAILLGGPAPAAAFESEVTSSPVGIPCISCHGGQSGVPSGTVAPTRKGPHGGYTTGTAKCETCHFTHDAPTDNRLMPAQTIRATCELCHDGTGGNGVYGVIKARTGKDPAASHRIDATNSVPAGSVSGTTALQFSGIEGQLTCSDCHSPHDNDTVAPFVGDRLRADSDLLTATPTNRLLKRTPGGTTVDAAVYGSSWCGACHRGSLESTSVPGYMNGHPVQTETAGFDYRRIVRVTGTDTTATEFGSLGGSNFGYVMPVPRSAEQTGSGAICQQCHEDARHVGDDLSEQYQVQPNEVFRVSQPDGREASDTPRFQVFPHESENRRFRLELGDDLCLNCHPKP